MFTKSCCSWHRSGSFCTLGFGAFFLGTGVGELLKPVMESLLFLFAFDEGVFGDLRFLDVPKPFSSCIILKVVIEDMRILSSRIRLC
jgi:hypothetical protein